MKERYKKIHSIKHGAEQNIGIATHIRVCRNGGQRLRCGTLFLFDVEFRGIIGFFRFFVNSR